MRHTVTAVLMGMMWVVAVGNLSAQIAGSTTPGMSVEELKTIARGWSATKQMLGKSVYNDRNDRNEKVGDVDDLIIAPDSSVSYTIIGVGGFLGLGERQVAIPVSRFKHSEGRLVLPDATKDALQAMPSFQYAQ
jgi:sporulation protein YlmC with PRC-barrel domain